MSAYCTVIIPTKNGMERLPEVLQGVIAQRTPWDFDVLAIDSGSSDGTIEYLKNQKIILIEIKPDDFGHGKTRNQAISATNSPFIAMITQDAIPVGNMWLSSLVAAVEKMPNIAGAFGRHIAHEKSNPFIKRDLEVHFDFFNSLPKVISKATDLERYRNDMAWMQILHFFSDNNACLRRSVWEKIPYPDADFAEDQLWAREIIDAGYSKAYAHEAVVRHSHDFSWWEYLQRSFDEARSFSKSFGYSLEPNILMNPNRILTLMRRDLNDLQSGIVKIASPVQAGKQLAECVAQVLGHYLGTNYFMLPQCLQLLLSRESNIRSMN